MVKAGLVGRRFKSLGVWKEAITGTVICYEEDVRNGLIRSSNAWGEGLSISL